MQPIRMIRISANTLAMVKIYWTLFVQLTLKQLIDVSNTNKPTQTQHYSILTMQLHSSHCVKQRRYLHYKLNLKTADTHSVPHMSM